jgi:hypothetical protein
MIATDNEISRNNILNISTITNGQKMAKYVFKISEFKDPSWTRNE